MILQRSPLLKFFRLQLSKTSLAHYIISTNRCKYGLNGQILDFQYRTLSYLRQEVRTFSKSSKLGQASVHEGARSQNKAKVGFSKEFLRLLRLAKPETKIIVGALACLVMTSAVNMSLPLLIGKIIDTAEPPNMETNSNDLRDNDENVAKQFGLGHYSFYFVLVGFFTAGAFSNFGRTFLLRIAGERLIARLRSRLFLKLLSQDSYFFEIGPNKTGVKTGDLLSRLTSDTQIISKTLSSNISDGMRSMISGCVGLSMMCYVLWKLTLCMSLMFPPLIIMSIFYGRTIKLLAKSIQENLGDMSKVAEEKLNGIKTIQSFSQQTSVVSSFNSEIKRLVGVSLREGKLSGIYYGVNGFVGNMTLIGLLLIGTRLISAGEMTIGDLSSFMLYSIYTGSSVFGLSNFYTEFMKGIGAAERLFELMDLKPKINVTLGKKLDNIHGDVKFENVLFSYPSRSQSILFGNEKWSCTIKEGENVCLVGPSGSGKSSVAQLLMRFYDPLEGHIIVNGHDIRNLNLNHYRSQIGYVLQEPLLFSGTIEENITFGCKNYTQEEVEEAAKLSNAYEFIKSFTNGFNTIVGPSSTGTQLSGGQKQRISLARTLIKKPHLIILDEATSALDSRLEEVVMQSLKRLSSEKNVTVILIAHRLSTIKNSERVIVLDANGRIVEDGKFTKLISNPHSTLNQLLKSDDTE